MEKKIVQRSQNALKWGLMTVIASAFLLSANQSGAAVGDIFTDNNFTYTVLTEEGTTGTVSVSKRSTAIPSGAVAIPDSVTNGSVTYSVTDIGQHAFQNCSSLTSVTIPDSVTVIRFSAFRECSSLANITIPDSVTFIGSLAFLECSSLTSVVIGKSVNCIAGYSFGCISLTTVYFKGDAPVLYQEPNFGSYPILYYIEGTSGWTTPTWNGYRTAIWEPPTLSFEVKEGKLILAYSGGSLQASSDLILWNPVEGALEGKYEVDLPKTGKTFYRIAQ
ncbi:MAG: leucine-rich repeat domain-containing protein [Clostridia bacterium]|nr:leucine-rich repeat domain-containing protein [Clostridia bacterium]